MFLPRLPFTNKQVQEAPRLIREEINTWEDAADLCYEDALLDAQLRLFFRAEYGTLEPIHSSSAEVLSDIRQQGRATACPSQRPVAASFLRRFVEQATRAMSTPLMGRVLPGTLALLMVVAAFGPGGVKMLKGSERPWLLGQQTQNIVVEQPEIITDANDTQQGVTSPAQDVLTNFGNGPATTRSNTDLFDNGELRLPAGRYGAIAYNPLTREQERQDSKIMKIGPQ